MEDPFTNLVKFLHPLFYLETTRNGKYIYPAVRQLKEAMQAYKSNNKNSFIRLLKAIKEALPHIEKWRINFEQIKDSLDALTKIFKINPIDWKKFLAHPKVSLAFQGRALNQSITNFSTWLSIKANKPFLTMNARELTQALVQYKNKPGFYQKFSAYLKNYPNFLFHLIMDSEKNFIALCQERLILYLTDQQIAKAIIKHLPAFAAKQNNLYEQAKQVVHTLNYILSNGRSVSTLLRNTKAKSILLSSVFFQLHQNAIPYGQKIYANLPKSASKGI